MLGIYKINAIKYVTYYMQHIDYIIGISACEISFIAENCYY